MIQLTPLLDRGAATPFAAMTYPHYAPDLLAVGENAAVVAVGATDPDSNPCGLALARLGPSGDAQFLSVLVKAPHRNRGVATALVSDVEARLRDRGAVSVGGSYPAGKETTPALERVLAKCGWDPPRPSMYLFTLPPVPNAPRDAAWLAPRPWPDGFELLRWDEVPQAARDEVAARVRSGAVPGIVSPFMHPDSQVDLRGSFGLLKGGRLVGWTQIHTTGPKSVRGTALYAEPGAAPPGVGLQLLAASVRRLMELNDAGEGLTATWGIHASNPFLRVFRRKVLPSMPGHVETLTMSCGKRLA